MRRRQPRIVREPQVIAKPEKDGALSQDNSQTGVIWAVYARVIGVDQGGQPGAITHSLSPRANLARPGTHVDGVGVVEWRPALRASRSGRDDRRGSV